MKSRYASYVKWLLLACIGLSLWWGLGQVMRIAPVWSVVLPPGLLDAYALKHSDFLDVMISHAKNDYTEVRRVDRKNGREIFVRKIPLLANIRVMRGLVSERWDDNRFVVWDPNSTGKPWYELRNVETEEREKRSLPEHFKSAKLVPESNRGLWMMFNPLLDSGIAFASGEGDSIHCIGTKSDWNVKDFLQCLRLDSTGTCMVYKRMVKDAAALDKPYILQRMDNGKSFELETIKNPTHGFNFSPDGKWLFMDQSPVRVYSTESGQCSGTIDSGYVLGITFDSRHVCILQSDTTDLTAQEIVTYEMATCRVVYRRTLPRLEKALVTWKGGRGDWTYSRAFQTYPKTKKKKWQEWLESARNWLSPPVALLESCDGTRSIKIPDNEWKSVVSTDGNWLATFVEDEKEKFNLLRCYSLANPTPSFGWRCILTALPMSLLIGILHWKRWWSKRKFTPF